MTYLCKTELHKYMMIGVGWWVFGISQPGIPQTEAANRSLRSDVTSASPVFPQLLFHNIDKIELKNEVLI